MSEVVPAGSAPAGSVPAGSVPAGSAPSEAAPSEVALPGGGVVSSRRVVVLVVDGFGVGAAPDAPALSASSHAHTLASAAEAAPARPLGPLGPALLPHLPASASLSARQWLAGGATPDPWRCFSGRLAPRSAATDTPTGHWELLGVPTFSPPPTFPQGFPSGFISEFESRINRGVLGNVVSNGVAVINRFDAAHRRSGSPIVYTSADSVFQIAAHVDVVELDLLHHWCEVARELLVGPELGVGRVISRPYGGLPGELVRLPYRRDFALAPPAPTVLELLADAGAPVWAVGKIEDVFVHRGIARSSHDGDNASAALSVREFATQLPPGGLLLANLVDTDSKWGHNRLPVGYASALAGVDELVAELLALLGSEDSLVLVSDHGNDPSASGSDHTREWVPCLVWERALSSLPDGAALSDVVALPDGVFSDLGALVLDRLGVAAPASYPGAVAAPLVRSALSAADAACRHFLSGSSHEC